MALAVALIALAAVANTKDLLSGCFQWEASAPLISPEDRDGDHYYSIKDPSVLQYEGQWHLFCTIRGQKRSHQIEYVSFRDWPSIARARRETLRLTDGYFCAPQVFFFEPQKKWYLVYQIVDESRTPALQPAFSTSTDITDPSSWTPPELLFSGSSQGVKGWIDFWVVCDNRKAHLFFTTLDGRMWRSEAPLSEFPNGWRQPRVVLEDDIYEASHTYRLKGLDKYLTIVEAQAPAGRRYYKAYLADALDGAWTPLAASADRAFAWPGNVRFPEEPWTDSFSHGELLRDGYDQTLTVDPEKLRFLFQGVSDANRQGKIYGQIPWSLGLLSPVPEGCRTPF